MCPDIRSRERLPALVAKAMVLENSIIIRHEGTEYRAKPLGWDEKGLLGGLKVQFTLTYLLFKGDVQLSTMRYDDIHNVFIIQAKEETMIIKPSDFSYNGHYYTIDEHFRGLEIYDILGKDRKLVGKAKFSLVSYQIEFEYYPPELRDIIRELSVLYIVKMIVSFMLAPI